MTLSPKTGKSASTLQPKTGKPASPPQPKKIGDVPRRRSDMPPGSYETR